MEKRVTALRHVFVGAVAALLAGCAQQGVRGDLSLDDVIERHTEARGGAEALDRVKSAAIDVTINEGGQTYNVEYHAAAYPGPLVRVDVIVGGDRVYSEGIDRNGVWLWDRSEPAPKASVADGAANALLHGVESNLVGIHRWPERGHSLKLMPRETIDNVNYYVLEATFSTGHKSYFYIDPESWLIARKRDERAYHPDADLTKKRVESRFSEYRAVDGVVFNDRNEDYDLGTGALLSTNEVTKRVINPDLPEDLFDRTYQPQQAGPPRNEQ